MIQSTLTVAVDARTELVLAALSAFLRDQDELLLQEPGQGGAPDVLVVEFDDDNHDASFAHVQASQTKFPNTEVMITSAKVDQELLLRALHAGVKEVLVQPLDPAELAKSFDRFRERSAATAAKGGKKRGKITTVVGGKAGTGATTLAVNLATSVLQAIPEASVAVVDLNSRDPDLPTFLDMNPLRTLQDIDSDLSRLDDTFLSGIMTRHNSGLFVLPLGEMDLAGGYISSDAVAQTLALMRNMFDFIFVDCGHLIDLATQTAFNMADGVLLVSTLSVPAVRRTKRLLDQLHPVAESGETIPVHLVVNKYSAADEGIIDDVEAMLGTKPYWTFPDDPDLAHRAMNEGVPVVTLAAKKELSKSYMRFAAQYAEASADPKGGSFLGGLLKSVSGRFARGTPTPSLVS